VQMVDAIEGGVVSFLASPDHRQPFARFDQFGADKEARDEAIKFLQQHRIIAKSNPPPRAAVTRGRGSGGRTSSSKVGGCRAGSAASRRSWKECRRAKPADRS